MGFAEDMDRSVKTVDERVEDATAPLKDGVKGLDEKLDKLCDAVNTLASNVEKLGDDLNENSSLLLVVAKKLGFAPKEK